MDANILCMLLADRINPEVFRLIGTEIEWLREPTPEETAAADDVVSNYTTLAAGLMAAEMKQAAIDGIQGILDAQAQAFGFDTIHTAAVWTISANPARKARADALVAWGDAVWDWAEAEWAKQEAGTPTYTDVETFLAAVPAFPGVEG